MATPQLYAQPAHPATAQLGIALRRARHRRRLSLEQAGALAKVHRNTLHRIETGKHSPSVAQLFSLATALEFTPSSLLLYAERRATMIEEVHL